MSDGKLQVCLPPPRGRGMDIFANIRKEPPLIVDARVLESSSSYEICSWCEAHYKINENLGRWQCVRHKRVSPRDDGHWGCCEQSIFSGGCYSSDHTALRGVNFGPEDDIVVLPDGIQFLNERGLLNRESIVGTKGNGIIIRRYRKKSNIT